MRTVTNMTKAQELATLCGREMRNVGLLETAYSRAGIVFKSRAQRKRAQAARARRRAVRESRRRNR